MSPARPRATVVGTGAMGSLFAAALSAGGAEVVAVDADRAVVAAIRRDGLRIGRDGVETATPLAACGVAPGHDARPPPPADWLIVFTKGYDTAAALDAATPWVGERTVFVTLQNGLGNVELIHGRHPGHPIIYGLTTLTAEVRAPGRIDARSAGPGETRFWTSAGAHPGAHPAAHPAAAAFASLLTAGGIASQVDAAIDAAIWRKLIVNCAFNPLCAVTDTTVGEVADRPGSWPVLDGVADEVIAVAATRGVHLQQDTARTYLRDVAREAHRHYPSMVADFRAGRPSEIDNLNGAVLKLADAAGLTVPYCRMLDTLVRIREGRSQR